ncbi:hypothetical protein GE09DRAFT_269424 [Coniochaeta sp. 2T2.1]|nr:hypothetical protein GE09DRAFT_269424 [Coniochaeta sp. 2T2.1]
MIFLFPIRDLGLPSWRKTTRIGHRYIRRSATLHFSLLCFFCSFDFWGSATLQLHQRRDLDQISWSFRQRRSSPPTLGSFQDTRPAIDPDGSPLLEHLRRGTLQLATCHLSLFLFLAAPTSRDILRHQAAVSLFFPFPLLHRHGFHHEIPLSTPIFHLERLPDKFNTIISTKVGWPKGRQDRRMDSEVWNDGAETEHFRRLPFHTVFGSVVVFFNSVYVPSWTKIWDGDATMLCRACN